MNREEELLRENQALRERLTRLGEASLRINESLDFDTVLQGVLDSACALTDARYGVLTPFDETGDIQTEGALSYGMTPVEVEQLWAGLTGSEYCEFFEKLPGPTRLRDLQGHLAAMDLPGFRLPVQVNAPISFLGVVLRYAGESFGAIYLVEKRSGPEFSVEDEETMVTFASQAALVLANSRRYREEQRARADLETLVNTSPVGVAVFDAWTGTPVSFNREARRMVDGLVNPGEPPERLLETLSVRWTDGREVSLAELPFAQLLRAGETLRAEELVLTVPDGRSIAVLVNVTPLWTEAGEVESVVVTLQDLTPLEELERLRAEFLAMVSHELRTPLSTIRGSVTTLLDDTSALHPAEMRQFFKIILEQSDRMRGLIADLLDVARIETGTLSVAPEPTSVAVLVDEARNGFRSGGGRHNLQVDLPPDLPWVMADRPRLVQVLGNLLANAARHSPQSTSIRVSAVREGVHVAVSVSDEGRGIPAESLPHLFRKFSRLEGEEQGGDTGLGLAICRGIVEAHGGRIWAESAGPGLGARFTFTLPTVEEAGYFTPAASVPSSARAPRRLAGERVRILAVDDEPQALRYIRETLWNSGYEPIVTADPAEALELMAAEKPQLALLDLMLPGTDGIELMQSMVRVRDVPVIFVSAYGQDQLVARAFEAGAADYVVKPFSPTELVARIGAALRKRESPEPTGPYAAGDLVIDYAERRVTLAGALVRLTAIEYRTLAELSANGGRVLTYELLLKRVWGVEGGGNVGPLRTVINTLRRRLGDDAANPTYIFTDPRVGYRMPQGETPAMEPTATPWAGDAPIPDEGAQDDSTS